MRDNKKLLALILFLLMGFFMFTFANPSDGIGTLTKPIEGEQEEVDEPEEPVIEVEDDNNGNNEQPVIVDINTAPVITVNPNLVKIILGEEYDVMTGVVVTDDRQPNLINEVRTTIESTDELEAGSYVVTYTVTDNGGNTVTATRTIMILDPIGDEDSDGYTNEEEKEAGKDFDDEEDTPEYQPNPTINYDNCPVSMTVYGEVPNFEECIEVTDEFYGTEGVETEIETDIDENNHGEYTVTITSKDNLGNETTEEFTFIVEKREVTVTIDDKESTYLEALVELTSNAQEVAVEGTDIGVSLSSDVTETSEVGTYEITGTWTNENYEVTFVNGTYTINAKSLEKLTEEQLEELLGVEYKDETVTYDGNEHEVVITGTLPEGVTVTYENNKGTNVGTYNGVATLVGTGNYAGTAKLTAKLTINPREVTEDELLNELNVTFKDKTVTYDGNEHEVVITGTLPEGITVTYEGNKGTEVGTYNGVATLVGTGNYAGEAELTATLTIEAKSLEDLTEEDLEKLLNVKYNDKTVTYDGKEHEVVITGTLPAGVTVSYKNNKGTNVGTYNGVATFTGSGNSTGTASLEATLTITEKTLSEEDITGFTFNGSTVTYNGEVHSLAVAGLPTGFEVTYENNNKKNVGTYTVVATITGTDNYSGTITKEATLVINKANVTVTADSKQSVIGEAIKDLTYKVAGTVYGEDDLNVELTKEEGTAVGEYEITVTASNSNYDIKTINAVYTISPKTLVNADLANAKLEDLTVEYDGNAHSLEVKNLPEGFTATYSQKDLVDAGTYEITATINGNGNYSGQVTLTATLTINPKEVAVNWTNTTFEYDGNKHMPIASAEIEVVVNVKEGTDGISAGTHTAVATMKNENKNYKLTNTEVNYTITSKNITELTPEDIKDVLGLSIADKTVTYNGKEQSLVVDGTIPTGVTVEYNNTNKATMAGTYPVVATITGTGNYAGTVTLNATLTINKAAVSIKAEDKELAYGDAAKELTYVVTSGQIFGSDDLNINLTR